MLARDCRPQVFEDVAGQELPVRVLKAIIANPDIAPKSLVLEGSFGCGKCLKTGTRIATPYGYLKIEDLCKNALDGHELIEGFCPVTSSKWNTVLGSTCVRSFQRVFSQQNAYVLTAQLENGELINGTPEHKVWVLGADSAVEWKPMGDLVIGDCVLRNNSPLLYGDYIPQKHFKEFSQHVKHVRNGKYFNELEFALEAILNAHPANRFAFYTQLFTVFHRNLITIKGPKALIEWLDALCQSLGVIPEIDWKRLKIRIPRVKQISYNMSFDEAVGCECYGEGNQAYLKRDLFISSKHLERYIEHGIETWNNVRHSAFQDKELQKYCRWTPMRVTHIHADFDTVYDVSMDEHHDFYAQGIINHNTTNARIFAKGLNCLSSGPKKPCGHCENCLADLEARGFYSEYDSAIIGSVEKVRELRDSFYANGSGYRVVVFDEAHLCSRQCQSALLKVLEEAPRSVFFLFCTTDPDKILDTIRSRSMELSFELVPEQKVYNSLKKIADLNKIPASDDALNLIVTAAHGHMRNAHMLLDKLALIGEEDFKLSIRSASDALFRYFEAVVQRNNTALFKAVEEVLTYPVSEVATSFLNEVRLLTRAMVGQENRYSGLAKSLGQDCLKLVKLCVSDWVTTSFVSDPQIEVTLICIFNLMMGSKPQSVSEPVQANRFSRR